MNSVESVNKRSSGFISKETPQHIDSSGISKTLYTHVSNLHRLLSDWERLRKKGSKICETIKNLKLHECTNDYYPRQTEPLVNSLLEACLGLRDIVDGVFIIKQQVDSLEILQNSEQPVICTWSMRQIAKNISEIHSALTKEIRLKNVITENIAHCRDENVMEVYVKSWELEAYTIEISAYLFADIGLSRIISECE